MLISYWIQIVATLSCDDVVKSAREVNITHITQQMLGLLTVPLHPRLDSLLNA